MSRLWRYGSVYSRTRDFIVGKINPWESRPLWFDVWTKHPPRRDPVLLERVPINPLGYRNRRHPDFNYNEPPKLVYKADHVRAQFRKDYIDSPISCLTSQQTVMPLSDRVACRMVERNYGDWDGIDVTSLRSNALYHRALRDMVINTKPGNAKELGMFEEDKRNLFDWHYERHTTRKTPVDTWEDEQVDLDGKRVNLQDQTIEVEYEGPKLKPQKAQPTPQAPAARHGSVYKILKELIDNKIKLLEEQEISEQKAKAAGRSGAGFTKLQR